jgi:hypothetical protein
MNQESFNKLVDEIMTKGFNEETAAHFASLIGDTPTADAEGDTLVIENGKVLAKMKLRFFSDR